MSSLVRQDRFAAEELDFIVNYYIKRRLGRDPKNED